MADIIEETFYINVNHIMQTALLYHRIALCQRVFCAPVGTETIAPLMEFRFAYRLQDLQEALLDQSVGNRRDAQRTGLAGITFWNFYPAYWLGLILLQPPFYIVNECCVREL